LLKKKGVKHSALNGKVPESRKWPGVKSFQTDNDRRIMVAHPQSGGSSLDFNCAHYCIFFSNSHNPLDRRQCEKRIHRGKIKRRRFYYDLIGNNTVEVALHRSLAKDESVFKGIMNKNGLVSILRGR
jgi:SNF2 family DNA or RNA helicase